MAEPALVYLIYYVNWGASRPLAIRTSLEAAQEEAAARYLEPRRKGQEEVLRWREGNASEWTLEPNGVPPCAGVWKPNRWAYDHDGHIVILAFALEEERPAQRETVACVTCRYHGAVDRVTGEYRCRRFPPTSAGVWVHVRGDDWCGEYAPQEGSADGGG
jgi:hypothetical protein